MQREHPNSEVNIYKLISAIYIIKPFASKEVGRGVYTTESGVYIKVLYHIIPTSSKKYDFPTRQEIHNRGGVNWISDDW